MITRSLPLRLSGEEQGDHAEDEDSDDCGECDVEGAGFVVDSAGEDGAAGDGDDLGELIKTHEACIFAESECLLYDENDECSEPAEAEAVDEDTGDDERHAAEVEDHERDAGGLEGGAEYGHASGAETFAGASECDLRCDAHSGDEGDGRSRRGWSKSVFAEVLSELSEDALIGEGGGY